MPYEGEFASKASHFDIVRNPDVVDFLASCEYLKPPSEDEGRAMAARFHDAPVFDMAKLPSKVIAIDGTRYEAQISQQLPHTRMGFVKIGSILIDMAQFKALRVREGRFVDPFRVAELQNNNNSLTFPLPSANIRLSGKQTVRDSFRKAMNDHLYSDKSRFGSGNEPNNSLRTTLFHLASLRPGDMGTGNVSSLKLHKCPNCGHGPIELQDVSVAQLCPNCSDEVYPTDCLRVWEEISEFQPNEQALNRFMMLVEHMMPVHYIRYLINHSPSTLSGVAFILDGPLAIFGTGAWLHGCIMKYLSGINHRLVELGFEPVLILGLQKTGDVVDYVNLIDRYIDRNKIFAIDDTYRYDYILTGRDPAGNGFGYETYYGQDFIFKTPSGRTFVFALPYPFEEKRPIGTNFIQAKTELSRYPQLTRALSLIHHFESDLYRNALIPVALAHRYTAISLVPGGRVLDLLSRQAFERR